MQIVCVYSGVSPFEQKLDYVLNIFKNTLNEIGVNVSVLDITKANVDYYNGIKQPIVENIFNHMKTAQGIIFAATAQRFAVNGAMQVILEHLDYNLYKDVLKDKPCISIITSSDDSEYMAGNYMNMLIGALGGVNVNNMLIGKEYLNNIEISNNVTEIIEKYAEDFYRMVKQNRKYFVSNPFKNKNGNKPSEHIFKNDNITIENIIKEDNKSVRNLTGAQVADLYKKEIDNTIDRQNMNNLQKNNINEVLKQYKNGQALNNKPILDYNEQLLNNNEPILSNTNKHNLNNKQNMSTQFENKTMQNDFNSEDDISHIAKLLGQRYEKEINIQKGLNEYTKYNNEKPINISPSISSLKQKTQSLYHYFQPQLASDINIVMQVSISGKENFNGFFVIKDGECRYTDGIYPASDVTIISDSSVWEEVLDGKCTLQKAFMLGRLKVKGNFVIISKFEQFFKII